MIDVGNCAFVTGGHSRFNSNDGKNQGQWSSAEGIAGLFNADIWHVTADGEDRITQLMKYDTVIVNFNSTQLRLAIELSKAPSSDRPFLIGINEGDAQDIEICYDREYRILLRQAIKAVDVFGALQRTTIPFFEQIGGKKHVIWTPAPCEEESFYKELGNDNGERLQDQVVTYLECHRTYDYTLAVISGLGYYNKGFVIADWDKIEDTNYAIDGELTGGLDYVMFCKLLGLYKVGIRMDNRYVDGRFHKALAGMKVASIGSNRIEAQEVLFPALTFDPVREVKQAREMLTHIMAHENTRKEIVDSAYDKLIRIYSPGRVAKTIKDQLCQFV